jgi:ABC-type multidrug transport system fused ATPase/permease subunit
MLQDLKLLYFFISRSGKRRISLYLLLMIFAGLFEILSLASVYPFLKIVVNKGAAVDSAAFSFLSTMLHIPAEYLSIILLVSAVTLSALSRLLLINFGTNSSYAIGHELGKKAYFNTIMRPYEEHLSMKSANILAGITTKLNSTINYVLLPCLNILSSCLISSCILGMLLYINFTIATLLVLSVTSVYILIYLNVIKRVNAASRVISIETSRTLSILQESMLGIRDIKMNKLEKYYLQKFIISDLSLRNAQSSSVYISQFPRYIIEASLITLIGVALFYLIRTGGDLIDIIPILGLAALGVLKVVPLKQQLYSAWINLKSARQTLVDVLEMLKTTSNLNKNFNLNKSVEVEQFLKYSIELDGISFSYSNDKVLIFKNVSLKINKGDFVGITGKSGVGKSTLIDVISGLLNPSSGQILVDGKPVSNFMDCWRMSISLVPQSIFLIDGSIKENIALSKGVEVDNLLMQECIYLSCLDNYVAQLPMGIDSQVGERGINLSGGLKQRIGIARALYKKPSLLIFDESTSALDTETEECVLSRISDIHDKFTIIMISHNLHTLARCDYLLNIIDGGVQHSFRK